MSGSNTTAGELAAYLEALFETNGTEEVRLIGSLPSYVQVLPGSRLDDEFVRRLFRRAYDAMTAELGADSATVAEDCADLLRFAGRPWDEAVDQIRRVAARMLPGREGQALIEPMVRAVPPEKLSRSPVTTSPPLPEGLEDFDRLFAYWFKLVTEPAHVNCVLNEMGAAWDIAVAIQVRAGGVDQVLDVTGCPLLRQWPGPTG